MSEVLCLLKPFFILGAKALMKVKCPSGMVGVCAPRHAGKSTLIHSTESTEWELVDLEELVKLSLTEQEKKTLESLNGQNVKAYSLHYKPLAKKYLQQLKKQHKGKRFLVFASDIETLKYCGIATIHSWVPSNSLARTITEHLNEEEARIFSSSRIDIMLNASKKLLSSFNSFDDYVKDVANKFNLQMRL